MQVVVNCETLEQVLPGLPPYRKALY